MDNSIPRLILHPVDVNYIPETTGNIVAQLNSIQFINQSADDSDTFLAGNEFINLLTFLGCSPNINLSPQDGDKFCSISIMEIHESSMLLGYTSMVIPRCPVCKHKVSDWKQHFHDWKKGDTIYSCVECQQQTPVEKLKWRQEAGYARFGISINHIHPHEAVPSEKLLATLQQVTQTDWSYFYATN